MADAMVQLRKGLAELCVLSVIARDEAYGYQIVQSLSQVAGLGLTESTVYPLLARLATARLVSVRTVESPAGPPRRYYRLTAAGKSRLELLGGQWKTICNSLNHLLEGA